MWNSLTNRSRSLRVLVPNDVGNGCCVWYLSAVMRSLAAVVIVFPLLLCSIVRFCRNHFTLSLILVTEVVGVQMRWQ